MKRPLAVVLGGGGARGAFQVGALRALFEADIRPDMLVGTSIGALNAAYLALHGVDLAGVEALKTPWQDVATAGLFPTHSLWLTVRILFNRVGWQPDNRIRDFFVAHGLTPQLRFGDLQSVKLILVASDLNSGRVVLYGTDPHQSVLEGVLASTALPPWVHPLEINGQFLMDGGVVSNLPIEPALSRGAKEIIALDLADMREVPTDAHGFGPFSVKVMNSVEQRQREMETALAMARGAPVHLLPLRGTNPAPFLDFSNPAPLMEQGYNITRNEVAQWNAHHSYGWFSRLSNWMRRQPEPQTANLQLKK